MRKLLAAVLAFAALLAFLPTARASSCSTYVSQMCVKAENVLDGDLGASVIMHGQAAPYTFSTGSVTVTGAGNGFESQGPSQVGAIVAGQQGTLLVKSTATATGSHVIEVQDATGSEVFYVTKNGDAYIKNPLAALYGGTGADLSAITVGGLPWFSATGVMSGLSAGTANYILASGGAATPAWTNTPTVLGTNITGVPAASVLAGSLGTGSYAIDGTVSVATMTVTGLVTPASGRNCIAGTVAIDATTMYFCVATNTWKRLQVGASQAIWTAY